MITPANIQLVGEELAIVWSDGAESYYRIDRLRAASPSAENKGEVDILGVTHGGGGESHAHSGVRLLGWEIIGNYAVRFAFSDGHGSGLYSYEYLRDLPQ